MEIFLITPYITSKLIKGKDSILADSLTQLKKLGLYEKCPCEEDDQDQEITILDKEKSIKVAADPDFFAPLDQNMILSITNETRDNANHNLDKDTFVLDDVPYIIDDGHPIEPKSLSYHSVSKGYNYMIGH